jgi:glyoxylase-like metal-dependent hydrolase (beta-lactamase superfamily II)
MNDISYSFKLGNFECQVISDGSIPSPDGLMSINCLFIRTGEHNVLIDTGEGPGINVSSGKLFENLKSAGIKNTEIDTIIITHGHGDHLGGNVNAKGISNFPDARFFMYKKEWDYWLPRLDLKPEEQLKCDIINIPFLRRNILPIRDRYVLVGDKKDIIPGIGYSPAPGHTPGNTVITVTSGDKQLLILGDLMHLPVELTRPDMSNEWDISLEEAKQTQNQIISRVVRNKSLVFFNHFPFPGLGHVVKKGNTFDWVPLNK